jgi:hypothetical protein
MFVLRAQIVTIFEPKMVTVSKHIQNLQTLQTIFSKLYNVSQPNFAILLILYYVLFSAVVFDSLLFT